MNTHLLKNSRYRPFCCRGKRTNLLLNVKCFVRRQGIEYPYEPRWDTPFVPPLVIGVKCLTPLCPNPPTSVTGHRWTDVLPFRPPPSSCPENSLVGLLGRDSPLLSSPTGVQPRRDRFRCRTCSESFEQDFIYTCSHAPTHVYIPILLPYTHTHTRTLVLTHVRTYVAHIPTHVPTHPSYPHPHTRAPVYTQRSETL